MPASATVISVMIEVLLPLKKLGIRFAASVPRNVNEALLLTPKHETFWGLYNPTITQKVNHLWAGVLGP